MAIAENLIPANRAAFWLFNAACGQLGLVDGDVGSVTTWGGTSATTSLQGVIKAKTPAENLVPLQRHIADSMAQVKLAGISTDALIAGTATIAGIRANLTNNDSTLSGTAYPSFALIVA